MQLQRLVAGGQLASFGAAGAGSSYQKAWKKIDRQTDRLWWRLQEYRNNTRTVA